MIGGAAIAVLGLFVVLRGGDDKVTIHVGMTLADLDGVEGTNGDCYGTGGYDDFGPGMDVVIRDGSGDVIGTGRTVNLDGAPQYFREELGEDLNLDQPGLVPRGRRRRNQVIGVLRGERRAPRLGHVHE